MKSHKEINTFLKIDNEEVEADAKEEILKETEKFCWSLYEAKEIDETQLTTI